MIPFTCPHCGKQTNVAEKFAGQSGPCASCGQTVTIPHLGSEAAPRVANSAGITIGVILVIAAVLLLLCGGGLAALLIPAVKPAREAARRTNCNNHLKQIAIALHNYHDTWNSLPPAYTVDANGNRLHSWRTLILPYLEQDPIYRQLDLTKPWDSPENAALTRQPVPVFCCPSEQQTPSNLTNYVALVGPGLLFDGSRPTRFAEITDGLSNTIMVVEVRGSTISWAEPRDIDIDLDANPFSARINTGVQDALGSKHPGGMHVSMGDGYVRFISQTIDLNMLRSLLTRAGGETVGSF